MAFTAFTLFTCAYLGLGVDRVFESDSYAVSMLWIVLMIVITLVCGILGGLTCAAISKSKKTCLVFVGIVFVLSLVFAIPNIMKDHTPAVRAGDVPNLQAMQLAQTPAWLCVVNPILGADGVLLGARMKKLPPV